MTRFCDVVGYGESLESDSGVWTDNITEVTYFGDVVRNTRKLDPGDKVNDDIVVNNSISIIADEYAFNNFMNIKYVRWAGAFWTVTDVEVRSPRLILTLGGVYNGPTG